MESENLTVGFLSYKPDIYEFLYNISCQISETLMFTDVAPIIIEETLAFLIYRKIDVIKFEAYRAIDSILKNNIENFIDRYGIDFEKYFKDHLLLLRARIMNDFYFTFGINQGIKSNSSGVLKTDMGRKVVFSYVTIPSNVPVYSYVHTAFNRETIELCEYTSSSDKETRARSGKRKTKNIFRNLIRCVFPKVN